MPAQATSLLRHLLRLSAPIPADASLLARWVERRDEAAFAQLVTRHGPMVLGVCRRILGDVQHAEDAFQATFLVLARKAARLRPQTLSGFLYGVALRLAKKARGAALRRSMASGLTVAEPIDPRPHPLDALSGRELLALIDQEVARLPQAYRLPVLLCVLQERPVEEAARMLGWGVGSTRGRLARGRQMLRERLVRRGVCLSTGAVALLAPAAVSQHLMGATARLLTSPVPDAVRSLAGASGPPLNVKSLCLGLLLTAVALGAALSFPRVPAPEPEAAPATVQPPQAKEVPRRDLSGDPLPAGALVRLGTLRFRAPGEIDALAFAPDGKTLAAASNAGLVTFDAADGRRLARLPTPRNGWGMHNRIAFAPDGKRMSGKARVQVDDKSRGVVRVWDLTGKAEPRDYDAENVTWLGWSAGGEPLAVCLEAGAFRLRELAAGRSRRFPAENLPRPELSAYTLCACTPGAKTIVVASVDRATIHVWDGTTGDKRHTLHPKGKSLFYLALSDDGGKLAACNQQAVQMWDLSSGKELFSTDNKDKYRNLFFSPDGKILAVLQSYDTVVFWDATTGREVGRTREKYFFAEAFHCSADGKTLATAERYSGTVHLFDVATGERKPESAGHGNRPHGSAFTPDGRRVITAGSMDGTVRVWDVDTGKPLARLRTPGAMVRDVALSADGRTLFSSFSNDQIWISDPATGERKHTIQITDPDAPDTRQSAIHSHLSADGKTLVTMSYYYNKQGGGPQDTLITGWDTSTRKQLFRRRRPGIVSWTAFAPDARVLALAGNESDSRTGKIVGLGQMRLEDAATGELLLLFPNLPGQNWPQAFSPDGRILAANNSNKEYTLRLWETATAAEILVLPTASNNRPAFSADGRLLALATPAGEIQVWDLARGRARRHIKGFDAEVTWLAFSPNGRKLLSGLDDSTSLVWDLGAPHVAPPGKLGADAVARAWDDLAGDDAARAFRARWVLASAPAEAVALLKDRLRPARPADAERLRRLLVDLNSEQFAVRTKAQAGIEEIGELAEPALRKVLADQPALEVRQRVLKLLERLRGPVTRPEVRQGLRAVAVLEDIASPAARRILTGLASGAPAARLTQEAREAITRLDRKAYVASESK